MTTITIENLNESRELDSEASAELKGGLYGVPAFVENMLMSVEINDYAIGGINFTNLASGNSVANVSGVNFTDVIGNISFAVVDG